MQLRHILLAALAVTASPASADPLHDRVTAELPSLMTLYTDLHQHPELSGQEVNFVFRAEKLAKGFGATAMLSEAAAHSLKMDGRCRPLGAASVEGIRGRFVFFALPAAAERTP